MFIGFPCSEKRKWLERIREYWREKAQAYEDRTDEGAETDNQDKWDHVVQPTDTKVAMYHRKWA